MGVSGAKEPLASSTASLPTRNQVQATAQKAKRGAIGGTGARQAKKAKSLLREQGSPEKTLVASQDDE